MITIIVSLAVAVLRLTGAVHRLPVSVNGLVAVLGFASMALILFRIIDPPIFYVVSTITDEGAVRLPMFLALLAAAGIAFGGCLALWKKAFSAIYTRAEESPQIDNAFAYQATAPAQK